MIMTSWQIGEKVGAMTDFLFLGSKITIEGDSHHEIRRGLLLGSKSVQLTRWTFEGKVMSLLFNTLSRFVIAFLPRSKSFNFMAVVAIRNDFRVVSSAYLRLLVFLSAILIPPCDSSSLAYCLMYSACKLNKQGDNIQP